MRPGFWGENEETHQALVDVLLPRHELEGREVLEIVSGLDFSVRLIG